MERTRYSVSKRSTIRQNTHKKLNLCKVRIDELLVKTVLTPLSARKTQFKTNEPKHARRPVPVLAVRRPDVVDPNPHREHLVVARPRCRRGLARRLTHELLHLVLHRRDRRQEGGYEALVNGRAAVCVVVRQEEGLVVLRREDVDPVGSAASGNALKQQEETGGQRTR